MINKKLFIIFTLLIGIILICGSFSVLSAEEPEVHKVDVPLTSPDKPVSLVVEVFMGGIDVQGYNGKTVLVEAKISEAKEDKKFNLDLDVDLDNEKEAKKKRDTDGMFHIKKSSAAGFSIEEENNVVEIKSSPFFHGKVVDLIIKVPFATAVKARGMASGKIDISNVTGDIEVKHSNGDLNLTGLSGTVVANTMNGDVKVAFKKVNLSKPMSFSTFNGDVDVTFPADAKFSLKLKTDHGEIFSDFQLKTIEKPMENPAQRKGKKFVVKFDKAIFADLNGGGEEVSFKTFSGDIYIRKLK